MAGGRRLVTQRTLALPGFVALALIACSRSSEPLPSPAPQPPSPRSAAAPQPSSAPGAPAPQPAVHVDRRVEVIAILERLAGASEYRLAAPTPYLADVDRQLAAFAGHPAVAATRELHEHRGLGFDQPMALAVHLDDQLALAEPGDLDPRWTAVDLAAYLAQVRAFAADAKLDAFLDAHRAYLAAVEDRFRAALARENPAPWFADRFGAPGARFTVVPALIQGPYSYGVRAGGAMYQLMGLGIPDAGGLPVVDDPVVETLVHEMAHSFVNPVIERHLAELEPLAAPLYALVEPQMRYLHYGAPKILLFESGVRAVTTLYVRDRRGERAAADAIRREVRRGFVWTAALADDLAKFREAGTRDLDGYAPRLVALFAGLGKRYEHGLPPMAFQGPIDAMFRTAFAIVEPSDAAVARYDAQIDRQIFRGVPRLVPSTPTVFGELPHLGLVAYGTAASNTVVADVLRRSGIAITADELRLGSRRFTGPHLVLIACWPRADDPLQGIVVYAAASDADVVDINNVRAGSTDWVVARKRGDGTFQTLAEGDFPHAADDTWTLP